ncbi:CBS domain-containing protein [Candidatus Uhrbacteria bacterium]|nr:CBS domain-containing protein [Candidatus Uhrbacteria bacterium]
MLIKEIMATGTERPMVNEDDCLRDVLDEMNRKGLGAVCVMCGEFLAGLVTDGDIRRLILSTQKPLPHLFMTPAREVGSKAPKKIRPEATLQEGLAMFEKYQCWVLPVIDGSNRLLGLVHLHRLLKALIPST